MKVKRTRNVKRILNFYKNSYAFSPPYRILVDGTFTHAALKVKVNIANELPKYLCLATSGSSTFASASTTSSPREMSAKVDDLDACSDNENHSINAAERHSSTTPSTTTTSNLSSQCEILTTNCCVKELENIGSPVYGALCILRQFASEPCGHVEPIPAVHCLLNILRKGNPGKYMLSTVDPELTEKVRNIAGVPLIYLHGATTVLEKPTNKSVEIAEEETRNAVVVDDQEIRHLKELKRKEGLIKDPIRKVGKKKKAQGPNPLAMKKKKTEKKK